MTPRSDTPQKIKFLKLIYQYPEGIKSGDIAEKFSIRTATVTRSLRELSNAGYLNYDPYQGVILTSTGEEFVRFLNRRHRILSLMFTRAGLCEEAACMQTELIEHLVPREHVDQICRSLGHPSRAACGIIEHDPVCCEGC